MASNRTSETVATITTTSIPNNVNAITNQSGGLNRTLTYDPNGSITSDGGTRTFEWDGANRLVAINYTGFTTRSEFTYDGLSRMVKIVEKTGGTINSTRKFVWEGQEKLEFRDAADAVTMRVFPQGQHNGTTPYFFTRDHLGSVREVLSGGGTVVARYDYDSYGRSTTILGTTPTDMNFTGLYRHSKSNLDLAVYRAYDPDLGRWLSRDPLKDAEQHQGPNLYAYVRNNPAKKTDRLGLFDGESSRVDPHITGPGHDPRINWDHNRTMPVSPSKLERCVVLCSKASIPSTAICAAGCGVAGPVGWWPCFRTTTLGVTAVRALCVVVCTAGPD